MQRSYTILLLLLINANFSIAQNCLFERSFDLNYFSEIHKVIPLADSGWIVAGDLSTFESKFLSRLDCEGNVVWQNIYSSSSMLDVVVNDMSEIYAVGVGDKCSDIGGMWRNSALYKVDLNGNLLDTTFFFGPGYGIATDSTIYPLWGDQGLTHIVDAGNGTLLSASNYYVIKIESMDTAWATRLNMAPVRALGVLDKNHYAGTVNQVVKLDSNGTVLNSTLLSDTVIALLALTDTSILTISKNEAILFNIDLQPINQISFADFNALAASYNSESHIAIAQQDTLGATVNILIMDTGLIILDTLTVNVGCNFRLADIANNQKVISLAGKEVTPIMPYISGLNHFQRAVIKTFDYSGNHYQSNLDIGITNVDTINFSYTYSGPYIFMGDTFEIFSNIRFDLDVTVKNFGTDTIHSFCVNSSTTGGSQCAYGYLFTCVDSVTIAPGETYQDIYTGLLFGDDNAPFHPKLTITTSNPNHMLDDNCSNDHVLFEMELISSLNEAPFPYPLTLSPNPASELINLDLGQTPAAPLNFRLMNITGKLVEETWIKSRRTTLPVAHLLPGLYLYQVIDEQGNTATDKIIVY